jgi:hypothetical protein
MAMDEPGGSVGSSTDTTAPVDAQDSAAPGAEAPQPGSAADVQLHNVLERLVRDAATAGIDEQLVHSAVQDAAAALAQAPVRNFVGILVERAVRERLQLRRSI